MSIQTGFSWNVGVALFATLVFPACKGFKTKVTDAGIVAMTDAGREDKAATDAGDGGPGTGGVNPGTAGTPGAAGGSPGGAGGAGGGLAGDCLDGSARLCKDDPDLRALGNCGQGMEICATGHWGPCSVQPATKDLCTLVGDDANCDGRPNDGCPCVDGATQACGPAADVGICKRGIQTCAGGVWGSCTGAVTAQPRDCSSTTKDNDCNGTVDNLDATCTCAVGATSACPGATTAECITGMRTCVLSADKGSSSWSSTCTALVGSACGAASCTTDASGNATFTPAGTCNSAGGCSTVAAGPCPGGRACSTATACSIACSGATGCANGYYCSGTTCIAKKAQGATCGAASECATGFCASGFCCNSACAGTCSSCSSANTGAGNGTCGPVKAGTADPLARCGASAVATCGLDGSCDGAGACRRWDSNQVCNQTCGAAGTVTSKCNGQGSCVAGSPVSCQKFACNGTACRTACGSDSDCASASDYCVSPSCMPRCRTKSPTNLVMNGGFDTALTAWGFPWSPMDATGCSTSGSVEVDFGDSGPSSPCFPVTPGRTYFFGFMGLRQLGGSAELYCYVVPFSDVDCKVRTDPSTGNVDVLPILGTQASPPNLVNGVWTQVNETVTTSAVTKSAVVACVVGANYYDMVYVNASSASF